MHGVRTENAWLMETKRNERSDGWTPELEAACNRYRAMMKSIEGKPWPERRAAINRFRAGEQ